MTLKITDDLKEAIEKHAGAPLYLVDNANNRYVFLRADQFEKLQAFAVASDINSREMYPLIDEVMKQDWDVPAMDVYNDYDAHHA